VQADVGEVRAQAGLHVRPGAAVERLAAAAQDVVDGGALHRRLPGLLMTAAGAVLVLLLGPRVPGLAQHLHDGGVARAALQSEQ